MSDPNQPTIRTSLQPRERLLLTKLRAPRAASDGVIRDRLIREIDRGVEGKLTLVVTPPGYGKSTLVSQWQSESDRASAWLSLDAGDNDFRIFLSYVVAAIQSIDDSLCHGTAAMINDPSQPPARHLIELLSNEVAESTRPFVLVLDDYHVIESDEVQDAVAQLLSLMPANMSLILTSRTDPSLPTLIMSARGELVELGSGDLRFTTEETRLFLIERQHLDLQATDLEEIERWAEGWPVALRLLAAALRRRSPTEIRSLLESLTDNVPSVSEYLWDEVIENQPPERKSFLLQTAILRETNPEIATEVAGVPAADELLSILSRDNIFISRLDGPGNWYRFHHLFTDVLRQRLVREYDVEAVRELHVRAARWYETNQFTSEAAYHAIQAQSWQLAAHLLVQICKDFFDQERIGILLSWLQDLPDEPLAIEPRLGYWLAWAQVRTGRPRKAHHSLEVAEKAIEGREGDPVVARAALQLKVLKSLFAWATSEGEAAAAAALEYFNPEDLSDRARTLIMLGMLLETGGKLKEAERVLDEARTVNSRLGVRGFQVAELAATGLVQLSQAKLREPAEVFRRVIAIGDEWNDLGLQNAHQKLGGILYEWNQLDEVITHADLAEALARRMGAPFHLAQIPALRSRVAAARGEWDRAFDEIELAIAGAEGAGYSGIVPVFEEMRSRLWLMTDQIALAQGWRQHLGSEITNSARYQDLPIVLTALRVQIRDGHAQEALAHLDSLCRMATQQRWNRVLISIQCLRALAEVQIGNDVAARSAIGHALQIGAGEGFLRTFLDEGPLLVQLLKRVSLESGPHRAQAVTLFASAGEPYLSTTPIDSAQSVLSPRERDVMRLVAAGLSNRDVGDALFISEETVKTHLRRIFDKLDVSSRTQAINRSQQLGLL